MDIRLDGRTAVITGGSAGLGLAMARRFAESGGSVAILARRRGKLEEARKAVAGVATGQARVEAFVCDVTDPEQIGTAFSDAADALGPADILVNNAGGHRAGPFLKLKDQDWLDDYTIKVMGSVRCARQVLPSMIERKWGRIINVLAISAKTPGAGSAPTSVSRAAGMAMTKALASEVGAHNVLVNAMLVGWFKTEQFVNNYRKRAPDKTYEEYIEPFVAQIPVGRIGDPDEFANLACFLASDAASHITGCAFNVDGGRSPVV